MSLLNDYIQKEQQLKQLQEELQRLENDQRLKSELEFKAKLEALMTEFGKRHPTSLHCWILLPISVAHPRQPLPLLAASVA